jgi:DNA invertase Pin-like site-specific DNA recombinase
MSENDVATWERVSSDEQDTRNQTLTLDSHCAANGYTVRKRFVLPDTSAFKGRHQWALDEIRADVAAGEYTRVIAVTSSRFERRDTKVGVGFLLDLDKLGGRLETADNPLFGDLTNQGGWHITVAACSADNEYSKKISDNVSRAFRRMDDAGSFRGAVPHGYMVTGEKYAKRLVPDPQHAEDVIEAFTAASSGTSTVKLGRRLGIPADSVARMLRNSTYSTGRYEIHRADGVTVTHRCEPLVSPAVQAAAIRSLDARRTYDKPSSRAISHDDLSGAVYCVCGHDIGMHRHFSGRVHQRRYRCRACGKTVHADKTDAAVNDLMSGRTTAWWLDRWLIPGDDHAAELDRVRLEYRELSARGLDFDAEDAERDRLRAEIKRLEAMPSRPAETVTGIRRDAAGKALSEADRWASLDYAGRRTWLTSGEFKVYVSSAGYGKVAVEIEHDGTPPDDPY